MAVTGLDSTYITALIGGNKFIYKLIERDDELIDMIIQLECNFWDCVVNNVPTAVDGSESCSNLMTRIYPSAENKNIITLPDDAFTLIEQYYAAKEQAEMFTEMSFYPSKFC